VYPKGSEDTLASIRIGEVLAIRRNSSPVEEVRITDFGDDPTRLQYMGEADSMRKTVQDLRIPNSWPSNLGEKVFYLFRDHLADMDPGPVMFEKEINPDRVLRLELVLKKLIGLYGSTNPEGHAATNVTLLG
jgi:hypothetical protein